MKLGGGNRKRAAPTAVTGRISVGDHFGALALVCIAIVILASLATVALSLPDRLSTLQSEADSAADRSAEAVSAYLHARRDALAAMAATPVLADALRVGDTDALGKLAARFRMLLPDAERVIISSTGGLEPTPEADPPIGYALVEQVNRALAGEGGSIEAHLLEGDEAQINIVTAAGPGGEPLGAVAATLPVSALADLIRPPEGALIELFQIIPETSVAVLRNGSTKASGPAGTSLVPDTNWQLRFTLAKGASLFGAYPITALIAVLVAAALAVTGTAWLLSRRVSAAAAAAGHRGAQLVQDLVAGQLQPRYGSPLRECQPGLDEALAAAVAAPTRHRPAPEPDRPGTPAEAPAPAPEPDHDIDEDGLDIMEAFGAGGGERNSATTNLDPSILRAYDIRGIVDETLTPSVVRALGQAIGSEAADRGQRRIVVGYDGRDSSPVLANALIEGLTAAGRDVIDIGRVPTPVVYFATHLLGTQSGIAVTGSHNPSNYNGLKMVLAGETLWGNAIQDLGRRVAEEDFTEGHGDVERQEIVNDYIQRIVDDVTLHRALNVVIDCGNGVAGAVAPELFRRLGCNVTELFCEVDGNFPNHHPDPTVPENLEDLIRTVRERGADIGIAFDGDGDRLGIVDNTGHIIWADRQMMLFSRDILSRSPGSDIIFDVKCTNRLADVISENAGVPLMWKTGHSLIKQKLKETNAPLAGEMSGHIFFNDRWYGFDDGLYSGARMLEILSMEERPSSEIFAELPDGVSTPELRVDLREGEPPRIIRRLLEEGQDLADARITTIDGLRVDLPEGWGLVRSSNTQPCLVMRFEGNDEQALEHIKALFRERLLRVQPDIQLPF